MNSKSWYILQMYLVAVFEIVNQPKTETNFRKSWKSECDTEVRYKIPNLAKYLAVRWKELILHYTSLFSFQSLTKIWNYIMIN